MTNILYNIQEYTKEAKKLLRDNKVIAAFENLTAIQDTLREIYPNNATNGDVIKALFPNVEIKESHKDMYGTPHIYVVCNLDTYPTSFTSDFWNAPYKEI